MFDVGVLAWRLTKLGRFAQDEGVRPELADGAVVEALVADGASEAAAPQDVKHVAASPYCSNNAADKTTEEETGQYRDFLQLVLRLRVEEAVLNVVHRGTTSSFSQHASANQMSLTVAVRRSRVLCCASFSLSPCASSPLCLNGHTCHRLHLFLPKDQTFVSEETTSSPPFDTRALFKSVHCWPTRCYGQHYVNKCVLRKQLASALSAVCWCVSLPEDGEAERPEDEWSPQVHFGSRLHVVLTSKHKGHIQSAEHKGLTPGRNNNMLLHDKLTPFSFFC